MKIKIIYNKNELLLWRLRAAYHRWMRPTPILDRALTFCLVISAVSSCRSSASPKGDPLGPAVKPPLVAAEPWPDVSRSKWVNENWKLHRAALAKAGLAPIQLDGWYPQRAQMNDQSAPWRHFGAEERCKLLENVPGAPPRLLYNPSDKFAVSADGKVQCLLVDYQGSLGIKKEKLAGQPRNCMGGAQPATQPTYHLYVLPEGVPVGGWRTVPVSYYDLDISYEEQCPMVPSARF